MERTLSSIIAEAVSIAGAQLEAARTLNTDELMRTTARRQDLQFELDFVEVQPDLVDDETRQNILKLRGLDSRLTRVLDAGSRIFQRIHPTEAPPTYGRNGRMCGSYAESQP